MSKKFSKALTIGGLLIVFAMFIATGSAQGQSLSQPVRVDIPFDFTVANKKLPAGHYGIGRAQVGMGDTVLAITNKDNRVNVFLLPIPVQTMTPASRGKLVFHRYGDQYFLFQVWPGGSTTGRAVPKSQTERELEQKARHSTQAQNAPTVETVVVSVQ